MADNYEKSRESIPTHPTPITIEERGAGTSIFTISNLFTESQCDSIVDYITKNSNLWNECNNKNVNNVECKYLTIHDMINLNVPESKELDSLIFKAVNSALNALYEIRPDFKCDKDCGYTLRKIYGSTKLHVDGIHSKTMWGSTNLVRSLSIIVVLNDDYDGGIFSFPNQTLKLKVKKGEAILFPPYWMYPHSVSSVGPGQARYTIHTWSLEKFVD